uniref:NADH-ubiquinone oxidoreductase chain 6 n=1 Tax=Helophorus sp. BMNH 724835 TaxID=1903801 RepID=A0A343A3U6_9COLE|nr:NADH dehydrogenase subunit 6 [Helophorus sp. BMNH 724835]
MFLMMSINMMLSVMFIMLSHPLSMGITMLMQVILISLMTGLMNMNWWFSYILFLIMIGGMLVLFIYMTSIASNEKFKYSNKILILMIALAMMMMLVYFYMNQYIDLTSSYYDNLNYTYWTLTLNKFLNFPYNMILFMIIIYLFITLIAVVKISNIKFGPLRQMN